jgi:hypothetical protein
LAKKSGISDNPGPGRTTNEQRGDVSDPAPDPVRILLPEKRYLFGGEILFVRAVKKTFQLLDDLLGDRIIFHFKIGRRLPDIDRFTATGTELPLLVPVDIRESTAAWTPDDEIHHYWLIASPLVYILRVRESGNMIRRIPLIALSA